MTDVHAVGCYEKHEMSNQLSAELANTRRLLDELRRANDAMAIENESRSKEAEQQINEIEQSGAIPLYWARAEERAAADSELKSRAESPTAQLQAGSQKLVRALLATVTSPLLQVQNWFTEWQTSLEGCIERAYKCAVEMQAECVVQTVGPLYWPQLQRLPEQPHDETAPHLQQFAQLCKGQRAVSSAGECLCCYCCY